MSMVLYLSLTIDRRDRCAGSCTIDLLFVCAVAVAVAGVGVGVCAAGTFYYASGHIETFE